MALKKEVEEAIAHIRRQFCESTLTVKEDGQGGAYLHLDPIDLGPVYTPETRRSWIGFHIPFQYPFADVYPHHVRADLQRVDGNSLGDAMSVTQYQGFGLDSVQISRRSNNRNDNPLETALIKLLKVIEWAATR
jgi:hypothetical protein